MTKGCHMFRRALGWQGGYQEKSVYWNHDETIWSAFDRNHAQNRYWCAFGTEHPDKGRMLDIIVECNPPHSGVDRRCAGAFVEQDGEIYLAHSGKIGGGRKGIGKSAFLNAYPHGNWQVVQWPDKHETEMVIIGSVDGTRLPVQIAAFVREVERFKQYAAKGQKRSVSTPSEPSFSPEFAGKRRPYTVRATIESRCDHGFVVNTLQAELEKRGIARIGKDCPRDLFVLSKNGRVRFLFEAKTDLATGSIYQGIGQLVYHTTGCANKPQRVFVLPGMPKAKTRAVLTRLGIKVLTYRFEGTRPVFKNLDEILI